MKKKDLEKTKKYLKNNKKIIIPIFLGFLILIIVFVLFNNGGLKGLMGNTAYNDSEMCPDSSYTFDKESNTCTRYTNPYLLGDINNDGQIDEEDISILEDSLINDNELTDSQKVAANVYQPEQSEIVVDNDDLTLLKYYLDKNVLLGTLTNNENIGIEKVCLSNKDQTTYTLDNETNKCLEKIVISKEENNDNVEKNEQPSEQFFENSTQLVTTEKETNDVVLNITKPSTENKYSKDANLTFKVLFEVNNDNQYYYKVKKFYNKDEQSYESQCLSITNGMTKNENLSLEKTNGVVKWVIYTDSNCSQQLKEESVGPYELNNVKNSVDIDILDNDKRELYKYDDKVDINGKIEVSGDIKYYYDIKEYSSDQLIEQSECKMLENNKTTNIEKQLLLNAENKKMVVTVYKDECQKKHLSKDTKTYNLNIEEEPLEKKQIIKNESLDIVLYYPQKNEFERNNTKQLKYMFNANVTDNNKYYYRWLFIKDNKIIDNGCKKITNNIQPIYYTDLSTSKINGKLIVYSDNECKRQYKTNITKVVTTYVNGVNFSLKSNDNKITYNQGDKVKITAKAIVNGKKDYYYIIRKYYDNDVLSYQGECNKLKNNYTENNNLTMNNNNMRLTYTIYNDNQCNNKYKEISSLKYNAKVYTHNQSNIGSIATNDGTLTLKMYGPSQSKYSKNSSLRFNFKTTIKDNSVYYYRFLINKSGSNTYKSNCDKLVNDINPSFVTKLTSSPVNVKLELYKDNQCKENKIATLSPKVKYKIK